MDEAHCARSVFAFGTLALIVLSFDTVEIHAFANSQSPSIVIGQKDFTSLDCATSQSGLCGPSGVAFDSSGNLWVTDHLNHRVLEFKPPFQNGMNASLVIGQSSFWKRDSAFSQSGFGPGRYYGPKTVIFDSTGDLWVIGFSRVLEFRPPFSSGMPASLVIGQKGFTSMGGESCTRDGIGYPTSGAFDSFGDLWIDDVLNHRVLEFNPPFSDGMNASSVIGQMSFTICSSGESQSRLNQAWGNIAFDQAGNLWVADAANNRTLEFRPHFSTGMNASLVIGQNNFVTGSYRGNCEDVFASYGCNVLFDKPGNLWLTYDNKFFEFKSPFGQGITTNQASVEIGQGVGMSDPSYSAFDSSGNLWVPDFGNNRVLEFACSDKCATSASTSTMGQAASISGQLQLLAIAAAALVVGTAVAVVLIRMRSQKASTK